MTGVPVPVLSGTYICQEFQLLSSESKYLSLEVTVFPVHGTRYQYSPSVSVPVTSG